MAERVGMQKVVRESERRLAEAQRIAKVGSWEYDLVTEKITWSEELFRLFGLNPIEGEPNLEGVLASYHPEDAPKLALSVKQAIEEGISYALDLRGAPGSDQNGSYQWYHAVGSSVMDTTGGYYRAQASRGGPDRKLSNHPAEPGGATDCAGKRSLDPLCRRHSWNGDNVGRQWSDCTGAQAGRSSR